MQTDEIPNKFWKEFWEADELKRIEIVKKLPIFRDFKFKEDWKNKAFVTLLVSYFEDAMEFMHEDCMEKVRKVLEDIKERYDDLYNNEPDFEVDSTFTLGMLESIKETIEEIFGMHYKEGDENGS